MVSQHPHPTTYAYVPINRDSNESLVSGLDIDDYSRIPSVVKSFSDYDIISALGIGGIGENYGHVQDFFLETFKIDLDKVPEDSRITVVSAAFNDTNFYSSVVGGGNILCKKNYGHIQEGNFTALLKDLDHPEFIKVLGLIYPQDFLGGGGLRHAISKIEGRGDRLRVRSMLVDIYGPIYGGPKTFSSKKNKIQDKNSEDIDEDNDND